jgi:hypothetical protein
MKITRAKAWVKGTKRTDLLSLERSSKVKGYHVKITRTMMLNMLMESALPQEIHEPNFILCKWYNKVFCKRQTERRDKTRRLGGIILPQIIPNRRKMYLQIWLLTQNFQQGQWELWKLCKLNLSRPLVLSGSSDIVSEYHHQLMRHLTPRHKKEVQN